MVLKWERPMKHPIRHIAVAGSTTGICPRCQTQGPVDTFCIGCCEDVGMLIGDCPECKNMGPMGHLCDSCGEREFCYVDDGKTICRHCGLEGLRGTYCFECLDPSKLSE
jgi:hypothetical protein